MEPRFHPYSGYREYHPDEMLRRVKEFRDDVARRRTIRQFSDRPVPRAVVEAAVAAAGAAPSAANRQPWHFVVVGDAEIKRRIRLEAERAERAFYKEWASREWLDALAPLGTDENKPYLETAPWLIGIFAAQHGVAADGSRIKHYYVQESVGIATGFLVAALHRAGLATLTHTPSPMGFLNRILVRPPNERAFLLLVAGYPSPEARVPDIRRKSLAEIATFL